MPMSRIISFDLSRGKGGDIDVSGFFPFSPLHAIRSTKPLLETLSKGQGSVPDFSLSRRLSLTRFRTIAMLDLARADIFSPDFISEKILDEKPRPRTLDIVPPLQIPYGALDIRR